MNAAEKEARERVVRAAESWLRTPYHHRGRVKGAGVDCAQLVLAVYSEAGVIEAFDPGHYPSDWHMHKTEERYLSAVTARATEVPMTPAPLPGDLVLIKFGNTFSHGAIVTEWPVCIHALLRHPVGYINFELDSLLKRMGQTRPMKAFSYWPREVEAQ